MIIRPFQHEDLPQVLELHFLGLSQTGSDLGPGPWDDDLKNIEDTYMKDGEFVVGMNEGKIIAMGALKKTSEEKAELKRMRVHPDVQRHGNGQMIYDYLEKRAKQRGYKKLFLDTSTKQIAAQKFYEKNGFREVRREIWENLETIIYEKKI